MIASIFNLRAPHIPNFRLLFGVNGWRWRMVDLIFTTFDWVCAT